MSPEDLRSKPKYQVLRSLLCGTVSSEEAMRAYNIFPHEAKFGGEVAAFVYQSRKGRFHIFVNESLSVDTGQEIIFHELYHIIEDMPRLGYVVGLDMYGKQFEIRADRFLKEVASAYAVK